MGCFLTGEYRTGGGHEVLYIIGLPSREHTG